MVTRKNLQNLYKTFYLFQKILRNELIQRTDGADYKEGHRCFLQNLCLSNLSPQSESDNFQSVLHSMFRTHCVRRSLRLRFHSA